jgi:hypothetical protein
MELKITEMDAPKNKKQVTYNDILSKMSMCVIDGKLQLYNKKLDDVTIQEPFKSILKQTNTKKINFSQGQMNTQSYPLPQYQQQEQQNDALPRLTERQYKQLIFLNNLKRQRERERMSQIKSTKILYSNNSVNINPAVPITPHLFRFIGK